MATVPEGSAKGWRLGMLGVATVAVVTLVVAVVEVPALQPVMERSRSEAKALRVALVLRVTRFM